MPRHGSVLSPERVTAARLFAGATFEVPGPGSKTIPRPGSRWKAAWSSISGTSAFLAACHGLPHGRPPVLSCLFSPSEPASVSDKHTLFSQRPLSSNILISIRISNSCLSASARPQDFWQGRPGVGSQRVDYKLFVKIFLERGQGVSQFERKMYIFVFLAIYSRVIYI